MIPAIPCPSCGELLPPIRRPKNFRQAMWGGSTCEHCGAEVDRWGRRVGQQGVRQKSHTLDSSTSSDRPAGLTLDPGALRRLRPDLCGLVRRIKEACGLEFPLRTFLAEQLAGGDANPALVVLADPLLVAASSTMFDRVVMLAFDPVLGADLVDRHALRPGSKLLTANTYGSGPEVDPDLFLPPEKVGHWTGLQPLIADFLTDDLEHLEAVKRQIPAAEWSRTAQLAKAYHARFPDLARDGRPISCGIPAQPPRPRRSNKGGAIDLDP